MVRWPVDVIRLRGLAMIGRATFATGAAALVVLELAACAAGGGGESSPASIPTPSITASGPPAPSPPAPLDPGPPLPASSAGFTSFANLPPTVSIPGVGWSTTISNYFDASGQGWSAPQAGSQTLTLSNEPRPTAWLQSPGRLVSVNPIDNPVNYGVGGVSLTSYGYPYSAIDGYKGVTFASGANYQTFGWWWSRDDSGAAPAFATGSFSVGAPTPGSAIPTSGSATFNGQLAAELWLRSQGLFVDDVSAPMSLSVNFGTRTAAFSSADWTGGAVLGNQPPATYPGSALSGELSYASGQNALTGTLNSANGQWSGQVTGRFYGPAAQEVGGALVLTHTGTIDRGVGGFGAIR
jgi:hypothetical protein